MIARQLTCADGELIQKSQGNINALFECDTAPPAQAPVAPPVQAQVVAPRATSKSPTGGGTVGGGTLLFEFSMIQFCLGKCS